MSGSIFHDASVLGVEFQDQSSTLFIKLRLDNKELKRVRFDQVHDFNLDSFGSQNILFDLVKYGEGATLPDEALELFPGLIQTVIDFVREKKYCIFVFEPSCGMSGYVISSGYLITD